MFAQDAACVDKFHQLMQEEFIYADEREADEML